LGEVPSITIPAPGGDTDPVRVTYLIEKKNAEVTKSNLKSSLETGQPLRQGSA
jgi:hypothetical protein